MKILEMRKVCLKRSENKDGSYSLNIENFSVQKGERVAITGPSGCGKSTALDLAGFILKPASAETFLLRGGNQEFDIRQLWQDGHVADLTDLRRKYMGYVLQTGELFSFLTVKENIELTALTSGVPPEVTHKRSSALLEQLEIGHLASKMPETLSIGERQRVAIARAMTPQPELILADEPTAALDPLLSQKVMGLFVDAAAEYGATVVLVTHDHNLANDFNFRMTPISTCKAANGINAHLGENVQ